MNRSTVGIVLAAMSLFAPGRQDQACGQFAQIRDTFIQNALSKFDADALADPIGACCVDGACVDGITQSECEAALCGVWQGDGSTCGGPLFCAHLIGGVCCTDGVCATQAQIGGKAACECGGGTWLQDEDDCANVICAGGPGGACCIDGNCRDDLTLAECEVNSCGLWKGADSDCATVGLCAVAVGDACCLGDVCTTGLGPDECACAGGVFQVGEPDCSAVTCVPPVGRCCQGTLCSVETEADCTDLCGLWDGEGTDCTSIGGTSPCGSLLIGACCVGEECLSGTGQFNCECRGGVWHGSNSCLLGSVQGDCNTNGIVDFCEDFTDCNSNGVPDECDKDCNTNGIPDDCEIAAGSATDCNTNGVPDECDIEEDCDGNGIPDECEFVADCAANEPIDCNFDGISNACEPDCNSNAESDVCELTFGMTTDCTGTEGFLGNFAAGQSIHNNNCAFCHGVGGTGQGGAPNHRDRSRYEYQRKTALCQDAIGHEGGAFGFPIEDYAHLERYLSDFGSAVAGDGIPDSCQNVVDCDSDGIADVCELSAGIELDCNFNGVPDRCDIANGLGEDCDSNGAIDECEIAGGTAGDCNGNALPDMCEVAAGTADDCNGNNVPDKCEADCNTNGIVDECENLPDCDSSGVPDECDPDCNTNSVSDVCEILDGADDCDGNGVPDDCQPDCNTNGLADPCDVFGGGSFDLNANGIPDECEPDCNANGVPDDLDVVPYHGGIPLLAVADLPSNGVIIPDCPGYADPFVEEQLVVDFGVDCAAIDRLHVGLNIVHSWAPDLLVELTSPAGTTVTLMSRITLDEVNPYCTAGECCGDDEQDVDVTFGDEFNQCIEYDTPSVGGQRPFAGSTQNAGALSAFTGEDACGVWTLKLHDGAEFDEGTLFAWSLDFLLAPVSEDCNGNIVPDECELAAGTSTDDDGNGIPDDCFMLRDCNTNGINDVAELAITPGADCNNNGVLDACELAGAGGLLVAGISSDVVSEFDPYSGRYVGDFVSIADPCTEGLEFPLGMIFAPNGNLLVCDYTERTVLEFDGTTGEFLGDFIDVGTSGLISPIDVDFGPDGALYVLSLGTGDVYRFSGIDGSFIDVFTNVGGLSSSFNVTFGPNGNLFATDTIASGVTQYDGSTGASLGVFTSGGSLSNPISLAFGPDGSLYVGDSAAMNVQKFDGVSGAYLADVVDLSVYTNSYIMQIAFGPEGDLWIPVNTAPTVLRIDPDTGALISFMQFSQTLVFPYGLVFRPIPGDCDGNGVPDTCEDCNTNGLADACDLAAGTSMDINSNGVPDECEGTDVALEIVLRATPSPVDTVTTLPAPVDELGNNQTFYAEIWARDQGAINTGLEAVYLDLAFVPGAVEAVSVDHRPPFTTLAGGVIDNLAGTITGLGGTDAGASGAGIEPQWARVAVVELRTIVCPADLEFSLSPAALPVTAVGRGAIDPADIAFGGASVSVSPVCIYNLDDTNSFIDAADLGVFAGCWLTGTGDPGFDPACDFDCSGFVDAGDLGWFAGAWLKSCSELGPEDYPACRQCSERCGGFDDPPCDAGQFCLLPVGQCCCDVPGVCQPIPQACPIASDPVCGCDDQTYTNECFAWMASQSVEHTGACAPGRSTSDAILPGGTRSPAPTGDVAGVRQRVERVSIGWRAVPDGAIGAGESFAIELYVRDENGGGPGVTAAFVDVTFSAQPVRIDAVAHDAPFTAFASGVVLADGVTDVGGATLAVGQAAGDWARFAVLELTAVGELPSGLEPVIQVRSNGVALRGRGGVATSAVRVRQLQAIP